MCTLTHLALPTDAPIKSPLLLQMPCANDLPAVSNGHPARFQVVLAGNAFFHIKEKSTGLVRGFRGDHNEACALARSLESKIELLGNACLR